MARLALPTLLALSGALLADIVHLNSGGRIEGIVEDSGSAYTVTTTAGVTQIPKDRVAGIEKGDCVLTVYAKEAAKVKADDAEGHWRLAQMCLEGKWSAKAREEAKKVVEISPDHAEARALLGFILHEGVWMTPRQRHEALGHVEFKGKWYSEEAARRLQAREERRLYLCHAEDAINLALAHLADENHSVRRRGHKEYLEAGKRYDVENAEATANKLLAYYDEGWRQYAAADTTIGTIEVRATNAHLESLDTIDVNLTGGASNTPGQVVVRIETPRLKTAQVRATVQCPLALKVHLTDPLLDQPNQEEILGD